MRVARRGTSFCGEKLHNIHILDPLFSTVLHGPCRAPTSQSLTHLINFRKRNCVLCGVRYGVLLYLISQRSMSNGFCIKVVGVYTSFSVGCTRKLQSDGEEINSCPIRRRLTIIAQQVPLQEIISQLTPAAVLGGVNHGEAADVAEGSR